jgi:hypothetical protein
VEPPAPGAPPDDVAVDVVEVVVDVVAGTDVAVELVLTAGVALEVVLVEAAAPAMPVATPATASAPATMPAVRIRDCMLLLWGQNRGMRLAFDASPRR